MRLILENWRKVKLLKQGYGFNLTLRLDGSVTDSQRRQVEQALRWWASFAGVGARTRRGVGAIKLNGNLDRLRPVSKEEVEALHGQMVLGRRRNDALGAWTEAVEALQSFRQGLGVGRNRQHGGNRPGRSRWPEPDAIREIFGRHTPRHEPEHPAKGMFPRAAFGLPLVFHFKDPDDPKGPTLEPAEKGRERMASPLILRPYFDGTGYRPLALLLPGWEQRVSVKVAFKSHPPERTAWPEDSEERREVARKVQPIRDEDADDALSAFMRYFERKLGGSGR